MNYSPEDISVLKDTVTIDINTDGPTQPWVNCKFCALKVFMFFYTFLLVYFFKFVAMIVKRINVVNRNLTEHTRNLNHSSNKCPHLFGRPGNILD